MINPSQRLLAYGFANPWLLAWLAAAAVPIVIHLLNRRRYREAPWAAMQLLLQAVRSNARRIQLRHWILLAVRTLIIVLMVLAVAEPFMEQLGLAFVPGRRTHKVLVIDASYSMAYRPTDESRFSRAKNLAATIVQESPQGDGFSLVLLSTPPRVIVGTPAFDRRALVEEIESLQLPHTGGDLEATLKDVQQVVQRATREHRRLVRHEVYLLTDLGRTTWMPERVPAEGPGDPLDVPTDVADPAARRPAGAHRAGVSAAQADSLPYRKLLTSIGQMASMFVLDLGQSDAGNLAVTNLDLVDSFVSISRDATFEAVVRNFGSQPQSAHLVELWVDGKRIQERTIELPPGMETPISFAHRFALPGSHAVEVRLGADLLDIDNHRWLAVPVKRQLRVLCVSGKRGASHYLVRALAPNPGEASMVHTQAVPESSLWELDLAPFDCIFLCNVGQFTVSEARRLDAYLRQGGGLIFFLGDRVQAEVYNRVLAGEQDSQLRILPAEVSGLVEVGDYAFDPLDYAHPIVSVFRAREGAGLLSTPVYRYFRLAVPDSNRKARVALAFTNGDPAIVEEPIHQGRSILVAIPASLASVDPATQTPFTTMPAWPSFLPVVQELLANAVGSQIEKYNVPVGQPLGAALPSSAAGSALSVATPAGQTVQLPLQTDADGTHWTLDDTDQSGVYTATLGAPMGGLEHFAVNVDTAESDLAKTDPDELPEPLVVLTNWQNLDERPQGDISRRTGLYKWLLYGVLALALTEPFLAWRFGRGVL